MRHVTLIFLLSFIITPFLKGVELPSVISDNMVLQRNTVVTIWGKASPGEQISVKGSWGENTSCTTNDNGKWKTRLQTPEAGGPFTLEISGENETKEFTDIMIGEVWLASGQSNMEMPLKGWPPQDTVQNFEQEIQNADYPDIRMFTVARNTALKPQYECSGEWEKCTPGNAPEFSATAYFFARKLHRSLGIPVGVIHSSWGGTPVESWTSRQYLENFKPYQSFFAQFDTSKQVREQFNTWMEEQPVIEINKEESEVDWSKYDFKSGQCANADFDDSGWKTMELPQNWENTEVGSFDGVIWYRKTINIDEDFPDNQVTLELGPVDDMDATYFNGVKIGGHESTGQWQTERSYSVPAKHISPGKNTIAVKVIDLRGGGGIFGAPAQLNLSANGDTISLAGKWKYLPVAQYRNSTFYLFDVSNREFYERPASPVLLNQNTPSALYNGMIAPVIPFTIQGTIWYQGESNTGNAGLYKEVFPAMIKNWRNDWQLGQFPFYYVQIAPYDYGEGTQSARLREAQLETLSLPNTGMAVTMDIGNPDKIHPANKQDVGKRLAMQALSKTYGKDMVCSGPVYQYMRITGDTVRLHFKHTGSGLKAKDGKLEDFEIKGQNNKFIQANARIKGNTVVVSHPDISNPKAVRYAWDNADEASLFNEEGLPAVSFNTAVW